MSDWAEKSNSLVAAYSATEDVDEAILNMGEEIDTLRTESAELRELVWQALEDERANISDHGPDWKERAEKALAREAT